MVVQPEDGQHAGQEDNSHGDFSSAFSGLPSRKANFEALRKHWNGFLTRLPLWTAASPLCIFVPAQGK